MNVPIQFEGVSSDVIRELIRGKHAKEFFALNQTQRMQRAIARDIGEHRAIDGLGQPKLAIHPLSFHYWGQRFGTYDCWNDKQFLHEFWRDNESARIKSAGGTRLQVGYGSLGSGATRKSVKSYG